MPASMTAGTQGRSPWGPVQMLGTGSFRVPDPNCVHDTSVIDSYVAYVRGLLEYQPFVMLDAGPNCRALTKSVNRSIQEAQAAVDEHLADARLRLLEMGGSLGPRGNYMRVRGAILSARENRRKTNPNHPYEDKTADILFQVAGIFPGIGAALDWGYFIYDLKSGGDTTAVGAIMELQAYYAKRQGTSAPPTGDRLGPPSPGPLPAGPPDPIKIGFVIHQQASGSFHIEVVNRRREAEGRARGWSATLRGLEADRRLRLLDPSAKDGPGTDAWQALMAEIVHARNGLRNAVTDLLNRPAADAQLDQHAARALPLVAASVRRANTAAPSLPSPAAPTALGPPVPPPPPPPPAPPAVDVAAICQSYQEGLTAGLGGIY